MRARKHSAIPKRKLARQPRKRFQTRRRQMFANAAYLIVGLMVISLVATGYFNKEQSPTSYKQAEKSEKSAPKPEVPQSFNRAPASTSGK